MQKKLFNIFFYLFFVFMINREFNPFGIDLRIIGVILSIILIILELRKIKLEKRKVEIEKVDYFIFSFFAVCFLSNIGWLFNKLPINFNQFFIVLVSYIGNFLFYIVFKLYNRYITLDKFGKAMKTSVILLILSMLLVTFGIDIKMFLVSNCQGYVKDLAPNFFGGIYRYGGFAEDPNYASLFLVFGVATNIYLSKKTSNKIDYIYLLFSLICFMLSASKTTLVAIVPALIFSIIKPSKFKTVLNYLWVPTMILVPIILVSINFNWFDSIITMMQRFKMWDFALELFLKNPIIGNGFTSFRNYLELSNWWYVQCHSTIFQMLSETGIISIILFSIILTISLLKNNKYLSFIVALFSIYMITTETAYHVYFIFVLAVLPIIIINTKKKEKKQKKATVYVVNSLSSGGAERVASVMANNSRKDVFVITLQNNVTYSVDSKIKIINLQKKKKLGKLEKYLKLPLLVLKFDKIYGKIKDEYDIELATTHLLHSHFLCRLSKYRNDFLFVVHNPYYPFDVKGSFLYRKKIQFLYNKMKVITVSKGVEGELKERYKVNTKTIGTIYNPIDFNEIYSKMDEPVKEKNYILFCGRFNEAKRPEHAIDLFYSEKLYKDYNLLMIGTGELEETVKKKIKQYKIEDKVILKGWCNNPYAYMKNALLMFNCSHFEAFPMTLIEALACDCKIVSYDINYGPNELLTGKLRQYLVPFDDKKKMASTIRNTIKKSHPSFEPYIENYKISTIINNYYKQYKKWSEK